MSSFVVALCQRMQLAQLESQGESLSAVVKELADQIARVREEAGEAAAKALAEDIVARIKAGGILTQEQVAWVLNVSTRHVRRLEERGILRRCPNLGGAVGYAVSDVLKLASARPWKED
jgi:DNA-binding transcriptional regulator YiaG